MHDIRLAVALIALASVAIFSVMFCLLRHRSKPFLDFIAVAIVQLMLAFG